MATKFKPRTSWRDKLAKDQPNKLANATGTMAQPGVNTLLIPRPRDVDHVIRTVRKGRLVTMAQIRARLAEDFNALPLATRQAAACEGVGTDDFVADGSCRMCTGIFLRIAAEAAEEDRVEGKTKITPYWRVIRDDGSLHQKLPGGPTAQAAQLAAEGHEIEYTRSGKPRVKDFAQKLQKL